ncbi:MAG: RodZ domain-containing protein [Burkholderiaceae bacterium]
MDEPSLITEQASTAVDEVNSSAIAPGSYGARLAWERQRVGLGVTDVAAELRLHPNQVRAIEQEDLSRLPELAYVRGFVRSYARVVNIDPTPLLADLNAKLAPTPAIEPGDGTRYSVISAAARERTSGLVIGSALLVLIVLGILGWQATLRNQPPPVTVAIAEPAPAVVPAPAAGGSDTPQSVVSEPAAPAVLATEPFPPSDSPSTPESSVGPVAPVLMLRFEGASWAEVTDRTGKVLLSKLGSAGGEHALDGELPLTVVIGDANKASVEIRGEAFNLAPFTRNNVARFTVK